MALISDLPNATPQKSDLMEIQNGQTSSNNSTVGQLMQLSASENLAPAYDANAGVYAVGDFVSYNGTLYQCNTAIATPEAFDATKWTAVKVTEISSGASVIQLTQAEYTALSTAEKMNGSIYKLTDKAVMLCLDEEYHPVKELTTAQYEALTTAEQNNGTIYIKTDAETTGEDIPVNTLTPDTSINSAINACFGRTGSDIAVSDSDPASIAAVINNLVDFMTLKTANGTLDSTYTSSGSIVCYKKGGTLVIKLSGVLFKTLTSRTTIGSVPSGFVPPTQATGFIDASTILWGVNADGSVWIDLGASGKQVWGTLTNIAGG